MKNYSSRDIRDLTKSMAVSSTSVEQSAVLELNAVVKMLLNMNMKLNAKTFADQRHNKYDILYAYCGDMIAAAQT